MAERKKTEVQTMIYKTLHRKQKILQHEPTHKNGGGGGLTCPRRVFSSCSTSGTRRVTLVEKVISHE
jgi:hypothetical protein